MPSGRGGRDPANDKYAAATQWDSKKRRFLPFPTTGSFDFAFVTDRNKNGYEREREKPFFSSQ